MEPAQSEVPTADSVLERIESLREILVRTDPDFYVETLRHLETVAAILRARRAVERRSRREAKIYWEMD